MTEGGPHRHRPVAVAASGALRAVLHRVRVLPLVAGEAEELLHLHLDRGLIDQPGAEPGDLLQHPGQVHLPGEQRVDLGTRSCW